MKNPLIISILYFIQTAAAQVPSINVSGRHGSHGVPGTSHSTSSQSAGGGDGRNGRNGGHAGPSTPGQHAGTIHVNLKDKELEAGKPHVAIVEMDASILSADGQLQNRKFDFTTGAPGFMYLQAEGGRGGNGGTGGNGEGGQAGADGCDATRYSSGCNGDDGGDGGTGGNATPGSDGGRGGKVEVKLKAEDSHLILLVQSDVDGGDGGSASQNGSGGNAGPGGSGGSSYSWTESVYDGEDCSNVDNGNGSYTRSCTSRYRTEYHSNPGGMSGSSGRSGRSGTGNTSAGNRGATGRYTITVDENGQSQSYSQAFSVRVIKYDVVDQNSDGIIEPDETMTIKNVVVQNAGQMPWNNSKAKFLVFLENSGWIMAEPMTLDVPSLKKDEQALLKNELKFKIKQTDAYGKEKRWSSQDQIVPQNLVTRVNRSQSNFTLVRPVTITFPLEITPLMSKYSVGPGETAKILWRVKNISQKALGSESLALRKILQEIRIKSQDTQDVEYKGKDRDSEFSLLSQDRLVELALMQPDEQILIEGEVKFASNALAYTDRNLEVQLNLGKLNNPQTIQKIQVQNFKFKISHLYNYNSDAQWVLVVNNNTERAEYLAWLKLAEEFGIKMDIWDVSYYGKLMLSKVMNQKEGQKGSFAENYFGRTIILLNNSQQAGVDDTPQRALDFLTQEDFVQGLLKGGLNVVIIGQESEKMATFEKLLVSKDRKEQPETKSEFFDKIRELSKEVEFGTLGQLDIREFHLFGQPSEEDLKKEASKLAQTLLKEDPWNRYIVSYDMNVEKMKWRRFSKKFRVQKAISPRVGNLIVLNVDDHKLHQPEFVHSAENILSLFEGMRFRNKLPVFAGMKNLDSPWATFLADAMIRDLIAEQNLALARSKGRWELIKRTFQATLLGKRYNEGADKRFENFAKINFNDRLTTQQKAGSELLRVVAALKFYAEKAMSWFHILDQEQFVSPVSFYAYRRDINRMQDGIVQKNFSKEPAAADALVLQHVESFKNNLKDRHKGLRGYSKIQNTTNMLMGPALGSTYSTKEILGKENQVREEKR